MNNSSLLTADRMTHLKDRGACAGLRDARRRRRRCLPRHRQRRPGYGRMEATVVKAAKPMTASTERDPTVR